MANEAIPDPETGTRPEADPTELMGQAEVMGPPPAMVPPPPPPPPPGAVPPPGPAPDGPGPGRAPGGPGAAGGRLGTAGSRLGAALQTGHGMTASQVASKLQLSAHAITVNDMVGAFGALLVFIGYFVPIVDFDGQGVALASHGGFWAALVPIFAPVSGAALLVPPARRLPALWLALAAAATGIALGSRNLSPFGYAAGWWLCFFGGIGLCYGWAARTGPRDERPPRS